GNCPKRQVKEETALLSLARVQQSRRGSFGSSPWASFSWKKHGRRIRRHCRPSKRAHIARSPGNSLRWFTNKNAVCHSADNRKAMLLIGRACYPFFFFRKKGHFELANKRGRWKSKCPC